MPGVKRKLTKEKGHPAWRLPGIHARQVREPGAGFSTGHPALAKRSRHPCQLPCGPVVPSSPPHRGPVEQRAIVARTRWRAESAEARAIATQRSAVVLLLLHCFDLAPLKSTRRMRVALAGAPLKRRAGGGKPAGWFAGMRTSLASVHGWTVDKPRNPPADLAGRARAWMPELRQRRSGCPMPARRVSGASCSPGYFSFTPGILPSALRAASLFVHAPACTWTSKREVPRPPKEDESSAFLRRRGAAEAPDHARAIPLSSPTATRARNP